MTEIACFVFARGGSRGLKNKNLLDFAGNAGDGLRHYSDMMEAFILIHSNAL